MVWLDRLGSGSFVACNKRLATCFAMAKDLRAERPGIDLECGPWISMAQLRLQIGRMPIGFSMRGEAGLKILKLGLKVIASSFAIR